MDITGYKTGAGAHCRVGAEVAEYFDGLVYLVGFIVTLRQSIKGFLVIRSEIDCLTDKAHRLFGLFQPEKRMAHATKYRRVIRVLYVRRLEQLQGFFVIFSLKFQCAEVVVYLKVVLFYGTGLRKSPIGLFRHAQFTCRKRKAVEYFKFVYSRDRFSGDYLRQSLVGLLRLVPGAFFVIHIANRV